MSIDVGAFLQASVPFVNTLGITFDHVGDAKAVARLADRPDLHNHVGGPHAGALFTLAETASGAVLVSVFGDQLTRATALAKTSTIRYAKLAKGDVTAEARLVGSRDEVVTALDAGERPEFDIEVDITRADGAVVTQMTITWTLRPLRLRPPTPEAPHA
ncbi:DUF4442 domain-containing protein [Sinosporangium siamense]|uniref:DUF4442 domain-containing protein n=1 Tax=Sinosporangium siamense TaxID=1367973 RepID=A0A919RHH4_9ACTN|nr:DUF4442 domain-containing protein [Sinosporangium siamense]GII92489.1 DUF4442 domain-containing protein [Sinosporangium siamense]